MQHIINIYMEASIAFYCNKTWPIGLTNPQTCSAPLFLLFAIATARDPDMIITSDFLVLENSNAINESFFIFTGSRGISDADHPAKFKMAKFKVATVSKPEI
jgi:hypothetical protein